MIRAITGTLINRLLVMVLAMAVVVLNTNFLGDLGQGEVALLNLGILVMLSVAHFISGGAVVYLVPRHRLADFWKPAYLWTTLVSVIGGCVLQYWTLVPEGYAWVVAGLAWLQSLFTFHMHLLLGQERIAAYNAVQLTYAGLLAGLLAVFYLGLGEADLWCYATCAGLAMVGAFLVSLIAVAKTLFQAPRASVGEMFSAILRYGGWSQAGNVFQILAYRAPYAVLERVVTGGTALVGIFSIHTYASEAIWNVGKSLSLVQYSKLANLDQAEVRTRITLAFLKISGAFTLVACAVLIALPEEVWTAILGPEFGPVAAVVQWTAIGILLNALTMIVSHHFAGVGLHKYNAIASALGCGTVVAGCLWWIGDAGGSGWMDLPLQGAAWAFNAGMAVQFLVALVLFSRTEKGRIKWSSLKSDLALLRGSDQ